MPRGFARWERSIPNAKPLRLGISACLLGKRVRFDGGHKRDGFLADTLGPFVEWVPVCPEQEAGFGTPREAMRLVRAGEEVRLVTTKTGKDVTEPLQLATETRLAQLATQDLDGFVLKKDSPSCGLLRVKVYAEHGPASRDGRGLFSSQLALSQPLLPLEEEGRLNDPRLRENFIERVFAYRRLRTLLQDGLGASDLVRFHTRHKFLLLAHSPELYAKLGRLVAGAGTADETHLATEYASIFMEALSVIPSRGRHANVLQHLAGHFKDRADDTSRQELSDRIGDYQRGLVPLVVPITLLAYFARRYQVEYLLDQEYLQPHPKELMLRNHA